VSQAARQALERGLGRAWRQAERRWRMDDERLSVVPLTMDNAGLPTAEVDGERLQALLDAAVCWRWLASRTHDRAPAGTQRERVPLFVGPARLVADPPRSARLDRRASLCAAQPGHRRLAAVPRALLAELESRPLSVPVRGALLTMTPLADIRLPAGIASDAAALWAERVLLQRDPAHMDHLMHRLRDALPSSTVVA